VLQESTNRVSMPARTAGRLGCKVFGMLIDLETCSPYSLGASVCPTPFWHQWMPLRGRDPVLQRRPNQVNSTLHAGKGFASAVELKGQEARLVCQCVVSAAVEPLGCSALMGKTSQKISKKTFYLISTVFIQIGILMI
jgi:hypothetical protein